MLIPVNGPIIEKLIADNPYYAPATIPGGMYRGSDKDTPTFGVKATLVTSSDVKDEVVYQLVKAVFGNFDAFRKLHPALGHLKKEDMLLGNSAPLHPGAIKYYQEAGLMKQ
jgi:TRAP transporter TAXI family solute receptor